MSTVPRRSVVILRLTLPSPPLCFLQSPLPQSPHLLLEVPSHFLLLQVLRVIILQVLTLLQLEFQESAKRCTSAAA